MTAQVAASGGSVEFAAIHTRALRYDSPIQYFAQTVQGQSLQEWMQHGHAAGTLLM